MSADRGRGALLAALLAAGALLTAGCGSQTLSSSDDRLQVVTTTALLRDLVANVGGDRVRVTSIVPATADPHAYEPTLRAVRDVVYADVAFSNYLLLEAHRVIKTLDANLRDGRPNISLAEDAVKYAAELIPLVEAVNLDTIWLGLRAHGDGAAFDADRTSDVHLAVTAVDGPGDAFGYLTGTFGSADVFFGSRDGFDAARGFAGDTTTLPIDAHTHMSWVFTQPGIYRVTFRAQVQSDPTSRPVAVGAPATVTFAVGVPPERAGVPRARVLDRGHADVTVDLDRAEIAVRHDPDGGGEHAQDRYRADRVVIDVPTKALTEIPGEPGFRFLGPPGEPVYQLPQAVLGRHVHGEIDPHLWQNVRNAMAYVELIRDTLMAQDPGGAQAYQANATRYLRELDRLDRDVRRTIAAIPKPRRYLVTTHDAFAYLARAYGLRIAGFVTPNPSTEPSLRDRRKLSEAIRVLDVPAVFLEPGLASRSQTLREIAAEHDVQICPIHSDAFTDGVTTYIEMMRANADSLRRCLQ